MGLQDFIVTPLLFLFILILLYKIRTRLTSSLTRKYFIPAFLLKVFGAFCLGVIYQFYYSGGDTFNYWQHGSYWVWKAVIDNPFQGLKMIFGNIKDPIHFEYFSQIWLKRSDSSLFMVKITSIIDIFTFHTYSATAIIFSLYSFSGVWAMFTCLSKLFPDATKYMVIAIFFVPSLILWGSGIMKDTLVMGALGWISWVLIEWLEFKKISFTKILILFFSFYVIFNLKLYILLSFVPAVFVWGYIKYLSKIKSIVFKILIAPTMFLFFGLIAFVGTSAIGEESDRYSLESIPEWSRTTAYDLRYWTGKNAGSGYSLGELDGTWLNMLSKTPAAINVTLFRPYIWEVSNPFMLLTAIESLIFLILTLRLVFFYTKTSRKLIEIPIVLFFLIFTLVFAFAVGVSTFNFGTLSRYRIPILPYFGVILAIGYSIIKTKRNSNKYA
jgi:hypothetical protein